MLFLKVYAPFEVFLLKNMLERNTSGVLKSKWLSMSDLVLCSDVVARMKKDVKARILALDDALLLIDVYPCFNPWKAPMMHNNVPVNSFLSLSYHNKNRVRANQTLTGTSWRQNMEACPSQLWNYDFSTAVKVVQRPCYMDLVTSYISYRRNW